MTLEDIQDQTVSVLRRYIHAGETVALLDFPRHTNAGDSMIWQGARAYLDRIGVTVGFVADLHHFRPDHLRERVPEGPILITGGGNFGDRWHGQQDFRERVIEEFPERKIIQLPQSLEFSPGARMQRAQAVVNAHPNLVLLIRDRVSEAKAREWFPNVQIELCPDMALGLGHLDPAARPKRSVLLLIREDSEARLDREDIQIPKILADGAWRDWGLSSVGNLEWMGLRMPENVARVAPVASRMLYPSIERSFSRMARLNVERARRLVSTGSVLITDRLHASVMGQLIGSPVIALDNANGKISAAYDAYLNDLGGIDMAGSINEALQLAACLSL